MSEEKIKMMGYVYFIKHKKISPIKIGMTESEDVSKRVSSFSTGSPYGIELIGYIQTTNPKRLESILHEEYRHFRLEGEWFDIPVLEAENIIENYSHKVDARKWIYLDMPFKFNWTKYSINEMKIFRCFFNFIEFEEKEFNYVRLKGIITKNTKVPECELTYSFLESMYNNYIKKIDNESRN